MGKYLVSVYRLIDSHTLTHMLCRRLFTVLKWLCGHSVIVTHGRADRHTTYCRITALCSSIAR